MVNILFFSFCHTLHRRLPKLLLKLQTAGTSGNISQFDVKSCQYECRNCQKSEETSTFQGLTALALAAVKVGTADCSQCYAVRPVRLETHSYVNQQNMLQYVRREQNRGRMVKHTNCLGMWELKSDRFCCCVEEDSKQIFSLRGTII